MQCALIACTMLSQENCRPQATEPSRWRRPCSIRMPADEGVCDPCKKTAASVSSHLSISLVCRKIQRFGFEHFCTEQPRRDNIKVKLKVSLGRIQSPHAIGFHIKADY